MIRPINFFALLLICGALAGEVIAAPTVLRSISDARQLTDSFMALTASDKFDEAVSEMIPVWVLPKQEIEQKMPAFRSAREKMKSRFGNSLGFRFISEDKVSDFLVRFNYAELRELSVIRWTFTYYRPGDKWILNWMVFDDDPQTLFPR